MIPTSIKKISSNNKPKHLWLIMLLLSSLFLSSCVSFLDPSKIRIVTSRAKLQRIARNTKVSSIPPKKGEITVKKGDTVFGIARSNNVPVRSLIEHNRLSPPYILKIGQRISLPPSPFHIVQKGDTLYSISRRYNVELHSLARVNNIKTPYNIYEGQKLVLPGSVEPPATTLAQPKATTLAQPKATTKISKTTTVKTPLPRTKPSPNIPRPDARSSNKFAWPVRGNVAVAFGPLGKGRHNDGINITAKKGTPVTASENGVVAYSGSQLKGFGNLLLLKHDDGFMTAYAHNDTIIVNRGDKVKKGDKIATVGNTGSASSPQLHFEIRKGNKALNPMLYLEK